MESSTQPDKRTVCGYIYRISHPKLWTVTDESLPHQLCYIGRTEKTVSERFQGHLRDAKKFKGGVDGDGKLHAVMSAQGFSGFIVEELDSATTAQELAQKEGHYQKTYDSINNGWNKIVAPITINKIDLSAVQISLNGEISSYQSVAHLCRELGIQNSTLTYWIKKRKLSMTEAVEKSLAAKNQTKAKQETPVIIFRRPYATLNDAVRDEKLNKHQLNEKSIRTRLKKGISLEDAFTTPAQKPRKRTLEIKTPDGQVLKFQSIAEAHRELSKKYEVPPVSSINQFFNLKKQTLEQAFGFEKRPWNSRYDKIDKLLNDDGYKFIGEKNGQSTPVVLEATKEIFSSKKEFAKTFGIEYTTVATEIKRGLSADEILKKRKHPAIK
jgi:transposase-like protein